MKSGIKSSMCSSENSKPMVCHVGRRIPSTSPVLVVTLTSYNLPRGLKNMLCLDPCSWPFHLISNSVVQRVRSDTGVQAVAAYILVGSVAITTRPGDRPEVPPRAK